MTQSVKNSWLAALRSGKYKQGRRMLNTKGEAYCCLGVLCEVKRIKKEMDDFKTTTYYFKGRASEIYPPFMVPEGCITPSAGWARKLAHMNDTEGKNFSEIADWIEDNVPARDR